MRPRVLVSATMALLVLAALGWGIIRYDFWECPACGSQRRVETWCGFAVSEHQRPTRQTVALETLAGAPCRVHPWVHGRGNFHGDLRRGCRLHHQVIPMSHALILKDLAGDAPTQQRAYEAFASCGSRAERVAWWETWSSYVREKSR